MTRAAFASLSCALLLSGCDKVVRIGTSLPEQSSSGGGSGGSPTSNQTGGDPSDSTGGTASSAAAGAVASEPDAGPEPDPTSVVNQPDQAGLDNAPNTDCADAINATPRWSFDTDNQDWQLSSPSTATLGWSDAQGMPSPGALLATGDAPPGDDLFVFVPAVRDLSSTIVTFNVLLETGDDLDVKLFAQSGDDYAWADGGIVRITAGAWTCVAFDLDAPAYRANGFDPTRVLRLGIGISGVGFRVFLDELSY